jgi:4-hydroxy-3-methylbut-2-enyl diphosphate reductase
MKIEVARSAGFCFGVQRAVDTVYKTLATGEKVYTLGQIVHNEYVCGELEKLGAEVIDAEHLDTLSDCTVIIRAHGVSRHVEEKLKVLAAQNVRYIDATCPFVKKIHRIVLNESEGAVPAPGSETPVLPASDTATRPHSTHIFIAGDPSHPEVQGIVGWIDTKKSGCSVVESPEEFEEKITQTLENTDDFRNIKTVLVAQTTFNHKKFKQFIEILAKKHYNTIVYDTICNATEERQREAAELAGRSGAMVVIGSRGSSNTRKLYEICKQECANTYFCEQPGDLRVNRLTPFYSVGITAGASTPKNIIKEVLSIMSEENFDQLLEESFKPIHQGSVVEGTVIRVKEDEIALNIGYKADGIITRQEYTNDSNADLRTLVKEGDKLQVKIIKVNDGEGQVMLSYKRLATERAYKRLEEASESNEIITAPVTEITKGGLSVDVEGVRVFIPLSFVSDPYDPNLEKYKDQTIEFKIVEFNPKKRRIIGNRAILVKEKKKELQADFLSKSQVGDIVQGVVKNVTNFGIFVDLGGIDGLVHVSEIGWGRIENPVKHFKVGDEVRAFVKEIKDDKIALSMKFPNEDPWADADEKFAVGTVVKGKVARLQDFGAFVELAPGVDGLLHVSQISKERIEKPSSVLKVGQEIEAVVTDINLSARKISLSMKALLADDEPAEEQAEDQAESTEGASEE